MDFLCYIPFANNKNEEEDYMLYAITVFAIALAGLVVALIFLKQLKGFLQHKGILKKK